MKRAFIAALSLAIVSFVATTRADDATGTWKWSSTFNNNTVESSAKLKQDGNKLTGVYIGRNNTESPIEEGMVKDNVVSFKVTREFNGQKRTTKYTGAVKGDTITGKSERERDGQTTSTDWVAKRQK